MDWSWRIVFLVGVLSCSSCHAVDDVSHHSLIHGLHVERFGHASASLHKPSRRLMRSMAPDHDEELLQSNVGALSSPCLSNDEFLPDKIFHAQCQIPDGGKNIPEQQCKENGCLYLQEESRCYCESKVGCEANDGEFQSQTCQAEVEGETMQRILNCDFEQDFQDNVKVIAKRCCTDFPKQACDPEASAASAQKARGANLRLQAQDLPQRKQAQEGDDEPLLSKAVPPPPLEKTENKSSSAAEDSENAAVVSSDSEEVATTVKSKDAQKKKAPKRSEETDHDSTFLIPAAFVVLILLCFGCTVFAGVLENVEDKAKEPVPEEAEPEEDAAGPAAATEEEGDQVAEGVAEDEQIAQVARLEQIAQVDQTEAPAEVPRADAPLQDRAVVAGPA